MKDAASRNTDLQLILALINGSSPVNRVDACRSWTPTIFNSQEPCVWEGANGPGVLRLGEDDIDEEVGKNGNGFCRWTKRTEDRYQREI